MKVEIIKETEAEQHESQRGFLLVATKTHPKTQLETGREEAG